MSCAHLAYFGFAQVRLRFGMKSKNQGFCLGLRSPCTNFAPTMIDRQTIDRINAATDIVDVVRSS